MSLQIQEQILLDLLFDQDLRDEYCRLGCRALEIYGLSKSELADFNALRVDALKLEAQMRQDLVLGQISKHLPLSIALLSSFDNGLALAKDTIKPYLMSFSGYERSGIFAQQLLAKLDDLAFFNANDKELLDSILALERTLCMQCVRIDANRAPNIEAVTDVQDSVKGSDFNHQQALIWHSQVQLSLLPLSYWQLKQELLDAAIRQRGLQHLWQYLQQEPVLIEQRVSLISAINPDSYRVLLSKPVARHASLSDPEIDLELLEFISAFAPLFNSINGEHALLDIINKLKQQSGFEQANETIIENIIKGFEQLFSKQFLLLFKQ